MASGETPLPIGRRRGCAGRREPDEPPDLEPLGLPGVVEFGLGWAVEPDEPPDPEPLGLPGVVGEALATVGASIVPKPRVTAATPNQVCDGRFFLDDIADSLFADVMNRTRLVLQRGPVELLHSRRRIGGRCTSGNQ